MRGSSFDAGDWVVIHAKDDFFAYVDGWRGTVHGMNNGLYEVQCMRHDGEKTLFVPPEQLALTVPGRS